MVELTNDEMFWFDGGKILDSGTKEWSSDGKRIVTREGWSYPVY